jgi:hypothetical protein
MVTFLGQSVTINTAAAPAGPAHQQDCMQTLSITGWNATAGATGMSCIVLLGLMEFMML